jgi:hypothetical protein
VEKLSAILSAKSSHIFTRDRRDALTLLGMLASADSTVVTNNLSAIVSVALGPRGQQDRLLVLNASPAAFA